MAKWVGKIGYYVEEETAPGYYEKHTKERTYYGDIINIRRDTKSGEGTNDTLVLNSEISIISDPFTNQNIDTMLYATVHNIKWKIDSIKPGYPRMTLVLGGKYNDSGREEN